MKHPYTSTLAVGLGLLCGTLSAQAQTLIPRPERYAAGDGQFTFTSATRVACDALPDSLKVEAHRFIDALNTASGLGVTSTADAAAAVVCQQVEDKTLGAEGYKLTVTPENITVSAQTSAGFFNGFQSLKMLLPLNVMAEKADATVTDYSVAACTITDKPRFGYRGFMLDCSRHFFSVDEIKRMLDVMGYYKMNRFHWHLTDDQGWRFEMPKYPKLQTIAATRQGSYDVDLKHGRYYVSDQYGPYYYTVNQMKDIVAYAAERHIEVIPEIEMPGHMCAAMTAYPELSCDYYGSHRVWNDGGVSSDVLDISNPDAIQFCKDILDELVDIFPSKYIHIGGDECPTTAWEKNADCQALKEELGLSTFRALQSHFTHELAEYMAGKDDPEKRRKLIAWNESITASGSATSLLKNDGLTIMCWTGAENASSVANGLGMATILTPQPQYYINRKQSNRPGEVTNAGSGTDCTLQIVYEHKPTVRSKTLGIQGTFWCEHVSSNEGLEYQALPRLIALAESAWTPESKRNFNNFLTRMRRDTTLLNYGGYAWCNNYLVTDDGDEQVMPESGAYYRLVTRATDANRANRCVTLLSRDATALAAYSANGAAVGKLWSDTQVAAETDTLRKYQMWQFVEDPDNPGKYAMVCEAWPDGSVSATASAASTDGLWSYDYKTRHYNFVLGEGNYYGKDGDSYYYSIRSDQYSNMYMNTAAIGKQLRINLYGNPADGNGGLFTFVAKDGGAETPDPYPVESIADGKTYRIEGTHPNYEGMRLSDNGDATLGYTSQPWADDAWTATATATKNGTQTITLTNAATGRAVSSTSDPVQLGTTAAELKLTWDTETGDYTLGTTAGALFIPIGEKYAVNPGTFSPTTGALIPQGSHYRFVEVARATYTAKDTEGKLIGTYTRSIEMGQPYTPAAPELDNYECTTDPATLTGSESVTGDLAYEVTYRRTAYATRLRSLDPNGVLISEQRDTVATADAAAFSWEAPRLDYYTYASADADAAFPLVSDSVINLTYTTEAVPSFAERLNPVAEIEDGKLYLVYDNNNGRNGYLNVHPLTRQVMTQYTVEGTPAYVWRAVKSGNGFKLQNLNGLYIPELTSGKAITAGTSGAVFTFTHDGSTWTIKGTNNLYFNGNQGSLTGWASAHPYLIYEFRTEPYYTLTYTCVTEKGGNVGLGTYTFYVKAGGNYTLEQPVAAPAAYPEVECSEEQTTGTMTGNLDVTYTFKQKASVGIDGITNDESATGGAWYDLSGRRIDRPAKGVYIRDGRKVILK